jgi:dual specificity phosphatase 12
MEEDRKKKWDMSFTARMRQIVPGFFLGNVEASYKRAMLRENGINAMVSLTDARWVWWSSMTREAGIPEQRHNRVQCVDSSTQDLLEHMDSICDFIDQMASSPSLAVQSNAEPHDAPPEAILIHCDRGISRSPTIIIAYLMRKYGMKREETTAFVQSKQKVKPSANFARQLQIWEELEYQVWEDEERTVPKALY